MQIRVTTADLAGCRYAISPLYEAQGALLLLAGLGRAGIHGSWVTRKRPSF